MQHYPDVDTYIGSYPAATQALLQQMRATVRKAAPQAREGISYGMPAYTLGTKLVYFAGYQHHIGFYPTASGIQAFEQELAGYKYSKGAVQFPIDKPLPLALVTRMVKARLQQVQEQQAVRAAAKKNKTTVPSTAAKNKAATKTKAGLQSTTTKTNAAAKANATKTKAGAQSTTAKTNAATKANASKTKAGAQSTTKTNAATKAAAKPKSGKSA